MEILKEFFVNIICTVALIAVLILIYCICNSVQRLRKKELADSMFEKIAWIVTEDGNMKYRSFDELIVYVYNFQSRNIEQKYRILEEQEITVAKEILECFRKDITRNYFDRALVIDKEKSELTNEEYFMFSLCAFLREKECETEFNGNKKFEKVSNRKYNDGSGSDILYELTDYGRSYMKLLHIASVYCQTSKAINANNIYKSEDVKKILDNNQITIARYRP